VRSSATLVGVALLTIVGCEAIIGAEFGDYDVAPSGASGAAGDGIGGTNGGNAASGGGSGGAAAANTGGGGGTSSGGDGGSSGAAGSEGGAGGSDDCAPSPVDSRYRSTQVEAGQYHTCAIIEATGQLKCWGNNASGQLGLGHARTIGSGPCDPGDVALVDLGTDRTILSVTEAGQAVALGGEHTCAVLDDRKIKCWGRNTSGQLGLDDREARGDEAGEMGDALPIVNLGEDYAALGVVAGNSHTCALLDLGGDLTEIKCWGSNASGENGSGAGGSSLGDELGEMALLESVDLGTGRWVSKTASYPMAAGGAHTCVIVNTFGIKCWGNNVSGQLGRGFAQDTVGLSPDDMGDNLREVELDGYTAHSVTAGSEHTCAHLLGPDMKCWGANDSGQLGLGHTNDVGRNPADMGANLPLVSVSDDPDVEIVLVDAGYAHTCVTLFVPGGTAPEADRVKCFGINEFGELGLGDTMPRGDAAGEMGALLPVVPLSGPSVSVTAGGSHTCALLDSRGVVCWGQNNFGQLGLGRPSPSQGDSAGEIESLGEIDLGAP
jgi:alpha-tubulin suppressor-like RCC1 family protein